MNKKINFKYEIEALRDKNHNYSILIEESKIINDFVCLLARVDCTQEQIDNYDKESVYEAI